jgi:hypothetical protein
VAKDSFYVAASISQEGFSFSAEISKISMKTKSLVFLIEIDWAGNLVVCCSGLTIKIIIPYNRWGFEKAVKRA